MMEVKEFSPFYKIRRILWFLRWTLGFPLRAKDGSYSEFTFITWLECVRFCMMACCLSFFVIFSLISLTLFMDINMEQFKRFLISNMNFYSTSTLDNSLAYLWPMIVFLTWLTYLIEFKSNLASINEFCANVGNIKAKMHAMIVKPEERRSKNLYRELECHEKMLIYGMTLSILTSILLGTWFGIHYKTLLDEFFQDEFYTFIIILSFIFAFQSLFLLYGPISCASELVICQYINSLTDLFKTWRQILESNPTLPTMVSNGIEVNGDNHINVIDKSECDNQER